jgi:tripartite-type tricarboxylate transporter receptor subunit TctC
MSANRSVVIANTAAMALGLVAAGIVAAAQSVAYPTRPVRMIVPYAPGGGDDTLARYIGQALTETFGQSFVIDNRGGGGTILGSDLAAKAPPDGYTLIMVASTHAVLASLYKTLPFDPIRDFAPIVRVASAPNILVVHPSLHATSVKELVASAKSRPGELVYASSGNGGGSHLAMELFRSITRIELVHVPYKGTGPAMIDLLSGQAKLMFGGMIGTVTHVRSGRVRAIAVSSATRSAAMPEVPTVAESGYPDYEATTWYGMLAPAATPRAIIAALNGHVVNALKDTKLQARIAAQGADVSAGTPEDFAAYIRTEQVKWAKVVKESGARPE